MGKIVTYVRIYYLKSVKSLCNHYGTHIADRLTYTSNQEHLLSTEKYVLRQEELVTARALLNDELIQHIELSSGQIVIERKLESK